MERFTFEFQWRKMPALAARWSSCLCEWIRFGGLLWCFVPRWQWGVLTLATILEWTKTRWRLWWWWGCWLLNDDNDDHHNNDDGDDAYMWYLLRFIMTMSMFTAATVHFHCVPLIDFVCFRCSLLLHVWINTNLCTGSLSSLSWSSSLSSSSSAAANIVTMIEVFNTAYDISWYFYTVHDVCCHHAIFIVMLTLTLTHALNIFELVLM